jgi:hypothetical protein
VHRWLQVLKTIDRKYEGFIPHSSEARHQIDTVSAAHANMVEIKQESAEVLTITEEGDARRLATC